MQEIETFTPQTKESALKVVKLQIAIQKLDIVRGLLVENEWEEEPFHRDDNGYVVPAKIGRRRTLMPETNFTRTEVVNSGSYRIEVNNNRTGHTINAYSQGYQSVNHYYYPDGGGSTFCTKPVDLLETENTRELNLFSIGSDLAFKYMVGRIAVK